MEDNIKGIDINANACLLRYTSAKIQRTKPQSGKRRSILYLQFGTRSDLRILQYCPVKYIVKLVSCKMILSIAVCGIEEFKNGAVELQVFVQKRCKVVCAKFEYTFSNK